MEKPERTNLQKLNQRINLTKNAENIQKAINLRRSGHSYGAIAKQLGEAKTTVHRWIKEQKNESGTHGMPVGTGFRTESKKNGTDSGTNSPLQNESGTAIPQKRNDAAKKSDKNDLS